MSSRAIRTEHARAGSIRPRRQRLESIPEAIPLFPVAPDSGAAKEVEARELWIGVHLPWLAVEALGPPTELPRDLARAFPPAARNAKGSRDAHLLPRGIVELQGQTQYIASVCERAARWGIRPGMSLAAALALMPYLETKSRDLQREKQLLEQLAARAQRFTPRVSLVPPDGLVLEVKGSLHLFGGAEGLCQAFESDCRMMGIKPLVALAPFPLAALAGARDARTFIVTQPAHLVGQLTSLPLTTLRWPVEVLQRLKQIGVYTIGDAVRLPRAGFARRFGKPQLAMLDRLTGRDADLRAGFQTRERFKRRHELLYELEHHDRILTSIEPLLQELGTFLKTRQCGITRLDCLLKHRHETVTRCVLRLAAPAANASHLAKLLGERLATLSLPEPVRAIELRSGWLVSRAPTADSLWQAGEHGGTTCAESAELIEHLRARLGHEAVYGLQVLASHRPESAWVATDLAAQPPERAAKPGQRKAAGAHSTDPATADRPPWSAFRRPAWLLPVPKRLDERDGLPRRSGPLALLSGPERIETAWWDGGDIARDYYVARDLHGVQLWIFRERLAPHRWFLHGVFG
jgi:protein ImuB